MPQLTRITLRAGLALALGLGLAWNATAQPDSAQRTARLDARLDQLGERLSVTDQQATALDAVAAGAAEGPAASWTAAARVLDVLTADQIAQLRDRGQRGDGVRGQRERGDQARSGRERRGSRGARRGGRGAREGVDRGARQDGDRPQRGQRAQLTDEQRQALRSIRDESREQRQALVQRLRDGSISDADFITQSEALRERTRQQVDAARPGDAHSDERSDRREAARAAREQALGLTDAQEQRLQSLRLDRIRQAPERLDMRPYLDSDGQLDRSAYREAQREQRQQARPAAQTLREQTEAVYTQRQRDLMLVHRAISGGGRDGRRGRRGGRRGR